MTIIGTKVIVGPVSDRSEIFKEPTVLDLLGLLSILTITAAYESPALTGLAFLTYGVMPHFLGKPAPTPSTTGLSFTHGQHVTVNSHQNPYHLNSGVVDGVQDNIVIVHFVRGHQHQKVGLYPWELVLSQDFHAFQVGETATVHRSLSSRDGTISQVIHNASGEFAFYEIKMDFNPPHPVIFEPISVTPTGPSQFPSHSFSEFDVVTVKNLYSRYHGNVAVVQGSGSYQVCCHVKGENVQFLPWELIAQPHGKEGVS